MDVMEFVNLSPQKHKVFCNKINVLSCEKVLGDLIQRYNSEGDLPISGNAHSIGYYLTEEQQHDISKQLFNTEKRFIETGLEDEDLLDLLYLESLKSINFKTDAQSMLAKYVI